MSARSSLSSLSATFCWCTILTCSTAALISPSSFNSNNHHLYNGVTRNRQRSTCSLRQGTTTNLFGMLPPREDLPSPSPSSGDDNDGDIEAARRRFEAMMNGESDDDDDSESPKQTVQKQKKKTTSQQRASASSSAAPLGPITMDDYLTASSSPPPPLTAISRERREVEITLLSSLTHGDDALADLWSLWFSERGPGPASELLAAEQLAGQGPRKWAEAEERLRSLIAEHGIYWAEPVNRLATLMYVQGRLEESKALCEVVLSVKPWHFGALSGIVLVCAGMGDATAARMWASKRLPTMQPLESADDGSDNNNARRAEWVRLAVEDAKLSLKEAEKRSREYFGKKDDVVQQRSTKIRRNVEDGVDWTSGREGVDNDDDSAWQ